MNIHKFPSNKEQASELANVIAKSITDLLENQSQVCIAVSGGKSPIALFHELNQKSLAWEKVTITLVDERYVNTESDDSNEHLIRKNLLINKAARANFTGLISNEQSILSCLQNANLNTKKIDLAILGMGEDGHTASIFPCCPEVETILDTSFTTKKYVITSPTEAMYQRIGLSLNGILEIPKIFLSINGETKLNLLKQASLSVTKRLPISYILNRHQNYNIYWHK